MNFISFLNSPLAWGAIAFCIPLILHILNRSRFKRVEWGAMHLLESVVKVNHRRFQIEQLLLLLVRCSIPALLAFTLAKPVLTGSKALEGDSPVSLVVLLDNSYSMDAAANGRSRFDEAIDAACELVEAVPKGSEISVIQTGGGAAPLFDQPVYDAQAVIRRLRTVRPVFGASDMQQSLDAGIAALSSMTSVRRELIVVSDFQQADWQNAAATINQQLASLDIQPGLTLLQTTNSVDANLSVDELEFSTRPLGVGEQLSVRATVRNHGKAAAENARVILTIDGKEESVTQVEAGAGSSTQTLLPVSFESPGSHVIEVEVRADDALEADNKMAAALTIWDQIDVLLVDGDPASQPLKSETDFLSVALTPLTFGRTKLADLVHTKTVTYKANLKAEFENRPKVVVLANVPKLSDAQANELQRYVQSGGAVFMSAGNRIDADWYNKKLGDRGLLAAEFGSPRGKINDEGTTTRIVAQHFDHPGLQFFNEPANGDLSTAEIRQWYELKADDEKLTSVGWALPTIKSLAHWWAVPSLRSALIADTQPVSHPIVMARLSNGDAFLVEKTVGDGVVIQMATACDADWSDLPMRPFFVPMMQQLVTTMATKLTPPRNISTGEAAVALFPPLETDEKSPSTQDTILAMTTPDGTRRNVVAAPEGNMLMARFEGTRRPGVYSMTTPNAETIHFVASTSRDESNPESLDDEQLTSLAEDMNATIVKSSDEYLEQDRLRRNGRDIWRQMLTILLVFMFLELVLQQRFSRVRT